MSLPELQDATPEDVGWTDADYDAAECEGWFIADCDGSENGPWQIQAWDDPDARDEWEQDHGKPYPFAEDTDVWEHIVAQAKTGSEFHLKAMETIGALNPIEHRAIVKWATEKGLLTELQDASQAA